MQNFLTLPTGQLYHISRENTFDLTIELALNGGLRLLVCGNRLPFYDIAYELARRVGQEYERILKEEISFSRAETCIQLVDFLSEMDAQTTPLLVSDLLSRFYAEADRHVDQLFFACQVELQRLSRTCPVFVSANPKPPLERLAYVLARVTQPLEAISTRISRMETDKEFHINIRPIRVHPCPNKLGEFHGTHTATLFPPIQE